MLYATQNNGLTPGSEYVKVTGIFHLVDLVCAGRTCADLAKDYFTVRFPLPLHVRETDIKIQCLDDVVAHLHASGVVRVIDVP